MSDENRDVDINQGGTQTSTDSSLLSLDTAGIRDILQVRLAVVGGTSAAASDLLDHIRVVLTIKSGIILDLAHTALVAITRRKSKSFIEWLKLGQS